MQLRIAVSLPKPPDNLDLHQVDRIHVRVADVDRASQHGIALEKMLMTGDLEQGSGGAQRVLDAIHRSASARPCPGLWNDAASRWNRATFPDCRSDSRLDASSNLVWVFGLVDAADQRATSQRDATLAALNPGNDGLGIGRYEGDEFYHANPASPGGTFEASASLALPPGVRRLYARHDGEADGSDGIFGCQRWLPLSVVADEIELIGSAGIVPFLRSGGGDLLYVKAGGADRRVFEWWHESPEDAEVIAESLEAWLSAFVARLHAGGYVYRPDELAALIDQRELGEE